MHEATNFGASIAQSKPQSCVALQPPAPQHALDTVCRRAATSPGLHVAAVISVAKRRRLPLCAGHVHVHKLFTWDTGVYLYARETLNTAASAGSSPRKSGPAEL